MQKRAHVIKRHQSSRAHDTLYFVDREGLYQGDLSIAGMYIRSRDLSIAGMYIRSRDLSIAGMYIRSRNLSIAAMYIRVVGIWRAAVSQSISF